MGRQLPARGGARGNRPRWVAGLSAGAILLALGKLACGDEVFSCRLTESRSVSESEARTAADLICQELRRATGGHGAFEVRLAALGSIIFVFVTASGPEPRSSLTVRLDSIEEVAVAAGRIAEAVVRGQPFVSTQRVDNLLEDEARPAHSKRGSLKFLVGVADVESPGHGARAAGFTVGILYAAPGFALPTEVRFAWDDSDHPDPGLGLFSISVGGRAYFSKRDVSPFAGGGVGVLRVAARAGEYPGHGSGESDYFDAERFGVAPYVEAGVEVLRLHRARVALLVRADFPLGALESEEIPVYSYGDRWDQAPVIETVLPAQSRYVVPVAIGVTVAF